MFLRIFRYRVQPQMRDRHLAVQARSAQLYGKYVKRSPSYFRRSGEPNTWVELHWYTDKAECQQVAQAVADDLELARLWREFQETLDPDYPPVLEEFGEYELPRPVSASPFSQPPIDAGEQPTVPAPPAPVAPIAKPVATAAAVAAATMVEPPAPKPAEATAPVEAARPVEHIASKAPSENGDGHHHSHANSNGSALDAEDVHNGDEHYDDVHVEEVDSDSGSHSETMGRSTWPSPPLPVEHHEETQPGETQHGDSSHEQTDELVIEDDAPSEPRPSPLSYNDGVWIVEPEDKPAPRREDH